MQAWLLTMALSVAPAVSSDLPGDSDVVIRVSYGLLRDELLELWPDLVLEALSPEVSSLAERARLFWGREIMPIADAAGFSLQGEDVTVTAVADVDAAGGPTWAVIVRGAAHREPVATEGLETRELEEITATMRGGLGWAKDGSDWIIGNERGLVRQLRHRAIQKTPSRDPLFIEASRLRKPGWVLIAATLSREMRAGLLQALGPELFALVRGLKSATVSITEGALEARLSADDESSQSTVYHALAGVGELWEGSLRAMSGAAGLSLSFQESRRRTPFLPPGVDEDAVAAASDWLPECEVVTTISKRAPRAVEARMTMTDPRALLLGLAAATHALATAPTVRQARGKGGEARAEVERLLLALRQAQLSHRQRTGRFVACSPFPKEVPTTPTMWPSDTCFSALGFSPRSPVRYQLSAVLEDGRLLLMARADPDGDGVPQVWYLDEQAEHVRGSLDQAP